MTQFSWADTYEKARILFGGATPDEEVESEIRLAFQQQPQTVTYEIDSLGRRIAQGKQIGAPWILLRHILRNKAQVTDVVVSDDAERERAVMLSEGWMQTAGMHFDRWPEVEDELFVRGRLAPFDTPVLREHMHQLWERQRRTGLRLEFAETSRAVAWKKANPHRLVSYKRPKA